MLEIAIKNIYDDDLKSIIHFFKIKIMKTRLLFIILLILFCLSIKAQQITVASYNIRVDKEEDIAKGAGWSQRFPKICGLISYHDFQIVGIQEARDHQIRNLLNNLPNYSFIGVAREDGKEKGEFVPIFYRNDLFTVVESGNFWLSETPSKPSKGFDAECYRIVSYGKFKVKKDGFCFWFFNTHFDHKGVVARAESAKLILCRIKEITQSGDHVILTGDFNSDQCSNEYHTLKSSTILEDSYDKANYKYAWHGTANNFDPNIVTDRRFDHIFVSSSFEVLKYGILTDSYKDIVEEKLITFPNFPKEIPFRKAVTRFPSDHYPVQVVLGY